MTTLTMIDPRQQGLLSKGREGGLLTNAENFFSTPAGQGLLAAGFGALAGRGSRKQALGQGGLLGLQAYAGAQDQIEQRKKQAVAEQMQQMQLQEMQQKLAQQQQKGNYLQSVGKVTSPVVGAQPNQFDPMKYIGMGGSVEEAKALANPSAFKPSPLTLSEGQTLYDPTSYKPIVSVPKQAAPTELSRMVAEMNALPPDSPWVSAYRQAIAKATTHAPGTNVSINTGQKGLDNEFKLRGEFKGEPVYKAHQEMQAAYNQIRQSLRQSSPAGDVAGATKIMKLLDPGSVVRESELGIAMQASGLMDRVTNYGNMVMSGQKLTPTQRKDFQKLADALYSESVKQYNAKRTEYQKLGGDYGLDAGRALGPSITAPRVHPPSDKNDMPDDIAAILEKHGVK